MTYNNIGGNRTSILINLLCGDLHFLFLAVGMWFCCAYWQLAFILSIVSYQSIKKIKRADRKGSESVTEEKFAILFSADVAIHGCDSTYSVQVCTQQDTLRFCLPHLFRR